MTQHPLLEHKRKHTNRSKHLNYPFTYIENQTSILDNLEHKTKFVFITKKIYITKILVENARTNRLRIGHPTQHLCKIVAKIDLKLNNV